MECALVGRAVAEEAEYDLIRAAVFAAITGAGGNRYAAADNAVGAENAEIHCHNVH